MGGGGEERKHIEGPPGGPDPTVDPWRVEFSLSTQSGRETVPPTPPSAARDPTKRGHVSRPVHTVPRSARGADTRPLAGLHGPIRWGRRGPNGHNARRTPHRLLSGGRATTGGIGISPWGESSLISTTARWQPAAARVQLRHRFSSINRVRLPVFIVDRLRSSHSCNNRFLPCR